MLVWYILQTSSFCPFFGENVRQPKRLNPPKLSTTKFGSDPTKLQTDKQAGAGQWQRRVSPHFEFAWTQFKHRTSTFSWVLFPIAGHLGLDGRDVERRKSFTFCPCSAAPLEGSSQRPVFSRGSYLLVDHHQRADLNMDFVPRARPWSSTVKQEGCPPRTSLGMSSQVSGSDVAVKSLKKVCTFISYL